MIFDMYTDVTIALNGQLYGNNSIVSITDIGEGINSALLCVTNNTSCCHPEESSDNRTVGLWYLPNGKPAGGTGRSFYQTRGASVVRLFHKSLTTSPSGVFLCEVPDVSGVKQSVFIGVYPPNEGRTIKL